MIHERDQITREGVEPNLFNVAQRCRFSVSTEIHPEQTEAVRRLEQSENRFRVVLCKSLTGGIAAAVAGCVIAGTRVLGGLLAGMLAGLVMPDHAARTGTQHAVVACNMARRETLRASPETVSLCLVISPELYDAAAPLTISISARPITR